MKLPLKLVLIVCGLIAWSVAVVIAGPMIGLGENGDFQPFGEVWVQALLIAAPTVILLVLGVMSVLRRRRGQKKLETAILSDRSGGDGDVLNERMHQALATLRRANASRSYLYDQPWYIIIGPPGSGKTTALLNADLRFPLAERMGQTQQGTGQIGMAMQGFGGTRYCDWWFTEDAVMIDTAGRYTTQDSDAKADSASWKSFLSLLKRNRPRQPINGVLLALSVRDLMNATDDAVATHARTIRDRLDEIHETLKIDFPVYVIFTMADLIAGFREYFGSYSLDRRKKVWGATFQTDDRNQPTHETAAAEFDQLLERLSQELMDRLAEESDPTNRIAIFGLPGQMAMLKEPVTSFLKLVFEPTRYRSNAILRGFYFTSGTQEGTPIDQVLGEIGRSFGTNQSALMSGRGRSYFLNELMTKVIFAEQGWVSYDKAAVRRASLLRWATLTMMLLGALGLGGAWGGSYLANRDLIRSVQAATDDFGQRAATDLQTNMVTSDDPTTIVADLGFLRSMPGAADDPAVQAPGWGERFGLSQRSVLGKAADKAYREALERLLRPRLILFIENHLNTLLTAPAPTNDIAIYETLKVYKLLGRYQGSPASDELDKLILHWFVRDWAATYAADSPMQADLAKHLAAMLKFDDEVDLQLGLNQTMIQAAEGRLQNVTLEDRAWSLIEAITSGAGGQHDLKVGDWLGGDAELVLQTRDGAKLSDLKLPGVLTREGFQTYFLAALGDLGKALTEDQWVLGNSASTQANLDQQMKLLGPKLMLRHAKEVKSGWQQVLGNLRLAPMMADPPQYKALSALLAVPDSPVVQLVNLIAEQTAVDPFGAASADPAEADALAKTRAEVTQMVNDKAKGYAAIGLDLVVTESAGNPGIGAEILHAFAEFQHLATGKSPERGIDRLIGDLSDSFLPLMMAGQTSVGVTSAELGDTIAVIKSTSASLPDLMHPLMDGLASEMDAKLREVDRVANAQIVDRINADLTENVIPDCNTVVDGLYPFDPDPARSVPLDGFERIFGPNGTLEGFFVKNLQDYVDQTGNPWTWRLGAAFAGNRSLTTLGQFERAAKIKTAFFRGGISANLSIPMTWTALGLKKSQKIRLSLDNGKRLVEFSSRDPSATLYWPEDGTDYQLFSTDQKKVLDFNGPWGLSDMIKSGAPRQSGSTVTVDYQVGKDAVSFELTSDAAENPFLLPELEDFKCPTPF